MWEKKTSGKQWMGWNMFAQSLDCDICTICIDVFRKTPRNSSPQTPGKQEKIYRYVDLRDMIWNACVCV